jgi:hypothetical protein
MIDRIRYWYLRNYTEITWFLIGLLFLAGLQDFSRGDYINGIISWGLAWLNYMFSRR